MKSGILVASFMATALSAISTTGAWAVDDWAYWDQQCAPKCATAGADGYPDGGCMDDIFHKMPTLSDRQRNPAAHVYSEKLTKLLAEKKALSSTPVKAHASTAPAKAHVAAPAKAQAVPDKPASR
jgi:hypothetical protein